MKCKNCGHEIYFDERKIYFVNGWNHTEPQGCTNPESLK